MNNHKSTTTYTTHKHHIIPKHMGGLDHPDNIVVLTVEEHSMAHLLLFITHGKWQDKIAWKALSGKMLRPEAFSQSVKAGIDNMPPEASAAMKEKQSIAKKGIPLSDEHRAALKVGHANMTPEAKQAHSDNTSAGWTNMSDENKRMRNAKVSKGLTGKLRTSEAKSAISEGLKRYWLRKSAQ